MIAELGLSGWLPPSVVTTTVDMAADVGVDDGNIALLLEGRMRRQRCRRVHDAPHFVEITPQP